MYTWVIRTAPICALVLAAMSCAGDDDAPASSGSCTPNMSSLSLGLAMGSNDPCGPPPPGSSCDPTKGHIAYATCDATGKWITAKVTDPQTGMPKDSGSIECKCMTCGNKQVEPVYGEECEMGLSLGTATCATLVGTGSTGTVSCDANCKYVKTGCTAATPSVVGGSGG